MVRWVEKIDHPALVVPLQKNHESVQKQNKNYLYILQWGVGRLIEEIVIVSKKTLIVYLFSSSQ